MLDIICVSVQYAVHRTKSHTNVYFCRMCLLQAAPAWPEWGVPAQHWMWSCVQGPLWTAFSTTRLPNKWFNLLSPYASNQNVWRRFFFPPPHCWKRFQPDGKSSIYAIRLLCLVMKQFVWSPRKLNYTIYTSQSLDFCGDPHTSQICQRWGCVVCLGFQ